MSTTASAQTVAAEAPEEETICITILTLWSGGLQDVRDIAAVPVPESYRRMLGGGPCNSLDVPSLITWNLSFGDERSTTAALRYLEQSPRFKVPDAGVFMRDLDKLWARDLVAYQAAEARRALHPGRDADIAFGRDPAVRRVFTRRETTESFILLAGQYLRAAEFFSSATLLDKAAIYLKPPGETLRVTAGDASIAMADDSDVPLPPYRVNEVRDFEMRAAILKARLSRAPADLAAAKAMLDAKDVALLRKAAENAYENGDGVCDVGDEEHLAEIKKACDDENDFEGRVLRYWRARAQLDLLGDGPVQQRARGFELAMKLLMHKLRAPWEAAQNSIREQAADDLAALLLQRFEAENAAADTVANSNPVLADDEQRRQRSYALGFLIRAERFAPPTENASRFRQIAERYLTVWRALGPDPSAQGMLPAGLAREAAYLERVLSALPQIGSGDVPPLK
ncbi:MAG: hypothetical protein WC729_08080 [Sphingomonas sp.]|uniref:hypothetical protein n=1 Tax=Sphingomonas sp. TaxID=28214 RepID=UPI003561CF5F